MLITFETLLGDEVIVSESVSYIINMILNLCFYIRGNHSDSLIQEVICFSIENAPCKFNGMHSLV